MIQTETLAVLAFLLSGIFINTYRHRWNYVIWYVLAFLLVAMSMNAIR